jgi:hypothetical protein
MLKQITRLILAVVLLSLAVPPAAAQRTAGRRGPLLVEAEPGDPVVFLDPTDPFTGLLDLHLLIENVSQDQPITITGIHGELTFRDGSTSPFELPVDDPEGEPGEGFVLAPGSGSVYFALLIVPLDAPTGGAVARVIVEYEVGGEARTAVVRVRFAVVQES